MYRVTGTCQQHSFYLAYLVRVRLTLRVHIECLLAGDRVRPDDGVLRGYGVTTCNSAAVQTGIHLFDARVDGAQTVQSLSELGGETLVRLHHVAEKSVTTRRRTVEDIEEGRAWGLFLKGDVRVPGDGVCALLQEGCAGAVVCAPEDQVDLREALGGAGCLVDVVSAEVAGVLDCFLDGQRSEVLVPEGWMLR